MATVANKDGMTGAEASIPSGVVSAVRLTDGVTAPDAVAGYALIYVDSADGDLKVVFGDGTVKVISADT